MKAKFLLLFLIGGSLGASVLYTAGLSLSCVDPREYDVYFHTEIVDQNPVGAYVSANCPPPYESSDPPFASVWGLDFMVSGGRLNSVSSSYAYIEGAAWYVINGAVGTGKAYFNYYFEGTSGATLSGANWYWPLWSSEEPEPFPFQFGVPFLLSIYSAAECCDPVTRGSGFFYGLSTVTDSTGTPVPNATLTGVPAPVPEPSFVPLAALALAAGWFVRSRRHPSRA